MRYKIKITLENGRSVYIDEMETEEGIRNLFKWFENHAAFFNGKITMWDCDKECEIN